MRAAGLLGLLSVLGCAGMDPWGDLGAIPALPSRPYLTGEPAAARAPEPPRLQGRTLTLAECISVALEQSPATRATWLAARSAAARVGEERAPYLPTLSAGASAVRSDTPEFRDDGLSPQTDLSAGFSVRYLLFDGGLRSARVRGAAAELLAANFRHNTTLQDVAVIVEVAYHERLASKALARVAEETVKRSEIHVELARARFTLGLAARFDVLKAETEKADSDLALVRARSLVRIAQGRLAQAMGLRVSESFEVEDLPQDLRKQELADVERLLEEAARQRPELQAARAQVEARRADVSAATSEYWPTVAAFGDYGWRDQESPHVRDEWAVGVGVNLPLFMGFGRAYRGERARSDLARAVAEHEGLLRGVELEMWTAYSRVLEAGEAVEAAKKLVAAAEEGARVAEGMYRGGTGSIIELVDSLTARTASRTKEVQAVLDWYTAMARFERAAGRTSAGAR